LARRVISTPAFGRKAKRILEIGFGNGEALPLLRACATPARDHIGIEVHAPGVGRLLNALDADGLCRQRQALPPRCGGSAGTRSRRRIARRDPHLLPRSHGTRSATTSGGW
jgi:tRNA (guanine-N7-)-methyltransferase